MREQDATTDPTHAPRASRRIAQHRVSPSGDRPSGVYSKRASSLAPSRGMQQSIITVLHTDTTERDGDVDCSTHKHPRTRESLSVGVACVARTCAMQDAARELMTSSRIILVLRISSRRYCHEINVYRFPIAFGRPSAFANFTEYSGSFLPSPAVMKFSSRLGDSLPLVMTFARSSSQLCRGRNNNRSSHRIRRCYYFSEKTSLR